jgi:hypothetical protein
MDKGVYNSVHNIRKRKKTKIAYTATYFDLGSPAGKSAPVTKLLRAKKAGSGMAAG